MRLCKAQRLRYRNADMGDLEARLQEAKVGTALRVERDHLAVDDRLGRRQPGRFPEQLGEQASGVVAVAGPERDAATGDDRLDPVAVPLGLEEPILAIEWSASRRRQHRLDERRLGGAAGAGRIERRERRRRGALHVCRQSGPNLVARPAGPDRRRVRLRVPPSDRLRARLGDQEPGAAFVDGAGGVATCAHTRPALAGGTLRVPPGRAHEGEATGQLLATKSELELARPDRLAGIPGELRLERAPVPAHGIPGAILAPRDHALEIEVLDRMVLRPGGEPTLVRVAGRAFRDGP